MQAESQGKSPIFGSLQCFCAEEAVDLVMYDTVYNFTDVHGEEVAYPICEFFGEEFAAMIFVSAMACVTIILTNIILRGLIMYVYSQAGCPTHSEEMRHVTRSLFLAMFFNTGLLLMVVNTNLTHQGSLPIFKMF